MENTIPEIDVKELGHSLREGREAAGLSRAQLADRTGIPAKAIEKFESGAQEPSASRLVKLSHQLELDVGALIGLQLHAENDKSRLQTSKGPAETSTGREAFEHAKSIVAELDLLRANGFVGAHRRSFVLAEKASAAICSVEPGELFDLAISRGIDQATMPEREKQLSQFAEDPRHAETGCRELGERIVDTAIFGRDLYSVDLDQLQNIADELEEDGSIERRYSEWGLAMFLGSWDDHSSLVPLVRHPLRLRAISLGCNCFDE